MLRILDSAWDETEQRWHDDMASTSAACTGAPLLNDSRATFLRALGECMELLNAAEY